MSALCAWGTPEMMKALRRRPLLQLCFSNSREGHLGTFRKKLSFGGLDRIPLPQPQPQNPGIYQRKPEIPRMRVPGPMGSRLAALPRFSYEKLADTILL